VYAIWTSTRKLDPTETRKRFRSEQADLNCPVQGMSCSLSHTLAS
jgi:hypothetical protein